MVDKQEVIHRENGPLETANRIASQTVPGRSNTDIIEGLHDIPDVVDGFLEQTNGWFEILDVRVYRDDSIGIPCRYRWTIKRWAHNDMDQWLQDNGWELLPHLKADSKEHNENEMEARYRKEIKGYYVYANFFVEFTNDVFEALQEGIDIKPEPEMGGTRDKMDKIRQRVRE